jgi:hypothetical protein
MRLSPSEIIALQASVEEHVLGVQVAKEGMRMRLTPRALAAEIIALQASVEELKADLAPRPGVETLTHRLESLRIMMLKQEAVIHDLTAFSHSLEQRLEEQIRKRPGWPKGKPRKPTPAADQDL